MHQLDEDDHDIAVRLLPILRILDQNVNVIVELQVLDLVLLSCIKKISHNSVAAFKIFFGNLCLLGRN